MSYVIYILIGMVSGGLFIWAIMKGKGDNASYDHVRYVKTKKELYELKKKIKDVADEKTSTTIDDIILDLN